MEAFFAEVFETLDVEILERRGPTDLSFMSGGMAIAAFHDPVDDAHVFAESGPEEFSVLVLAEPVHMEEARQVGEVAAHLEPVTEVLAHVVAAEWQHRHRIAADLADLAEGGGGGFRSHRRAEVHAMTPVEGLKY